MVSSTVLLITFYENVLSASVAVFLVWSRRFWMSLPLKSLLIFLPIFLLMFLEKDKTPQTFTNIQSSDSMNSVSILYVTR